MRILVTGGVGTVGAGLNKDLRARGHHVVSCDLYHQPDEVGFSLRSDLETPLYARCDVGEFRQIERVFERLGPFDYVYHCAAEFGRWNGEDFYETLWRTNAVGTKNIIRLQERLKFRLIHFSSSEVYGDWPELCWRRRLSTECLILYMKPPLDYMVENVSQTVVKIVLGYDPGPVIMKR